MLSLRSMLYTWNTQPGTQNPEPRTGIRNPAPGNQNPDYGIQNQEYRIYNLEPYDIEVSTRSMGMTHPRAPSVYSIDMPLARVPLSAAVRRNCTLWQGVFLYSILKNTCRR